MAREYTEFEIQKALGTLPTFAVSVHIYCHSRRSLDVYRFAVDAFDEAHAIKRTKAYLHEEHHDHISMNVLNARETKYIVCRTHDLEYLASGAFISDVIYIGSTNA